MKIKVFAIGKIKEKYLKDAISEYQKRLSKYTKLEIIELNDISNLNRNDIIEKEGINILNNIKDKDYVITLDINGIKMNSVKFADTLAKTLIINSNIVFIIGGSYGLSNSVSARSNLKLSFSDLTFPHQLFRVILLEQIYRAFKINNNEEYHK